MRLALLLALTLAATATRADIPHADIQCTDAARSTWLPQSQFRAQMKAQGIQITKFLVTAGNCYEIYGFDAQRHKVERYHDPVSGRSMKVEQVRPRN